ncbi:MAG: hypothetical protein IT427_02850 [Pirellulales bacterium]|nr:hypothetical protein [Pirellulales bacterium]
MTLRFTFGALLAALVATGCALPLNSPLEHISQLRPVFEPRTNVLPPAQMLMHPGPGVDGPGPGVMMAGGPGLGAYGAAGMAPGMFPGGGGPGGAVGGNGAPCGDVEQACCWSGCGGCCAGNGAWGNDMAAAGGAGWGMGMGSYPTSQIGFIGSDGMQVRWDVGSPGLFDSEPLVEPGRYNFPQGAIYRLKLTDIPSYPGVELYPTLEVAPTVPRTEAFIAHNFIPFQLTDDDFKQVLSGNFVTKVIYLPDPEYQELALAGVETLVSTRLDPGVDPIVEADRRGSILAIIRLGNKDLQNAAAGGFAANRGGDVEQAGYWGPCPCPKPSIAAQVGQPTAVPPQFVAGVTAPEWGMPYCGTPIGLPGPPHIPLGVPAGLQQHVMKNHTAMHIPGPTKKVKIDVKQEPGLSYPHPASHVHIVERSTVPPVEFRQPWHMSHQVVPGVQCGDGECSDGQCSDGQCSPQ